MILILEMRTVVLAAASVASPSMCPINLLIASKYWS